MESFRVLSDQKETWGDKEFEDCNMEESLKGGRKKKKKKTLKPSCMRKQRVWKLPIFLLYRFAVTTAYLISFLPLFLSTWCINTDRTCLLWLRSYVYISILFFWVQNFYALFILIWDPFFSFVCVCVYIRQASLACHWCVCEIAWMLFQ